MTESLYEFNGRILVSGGIFEILKVRVNEADNIRLYYAGDIRTKDNIEHGIEGTDRWLATPGDFEHRMPGDEFFDRVFRLDIRDPEPFWGPNRFTLAPDLDSAMRHHILHAILEVNPNLPWIPARRR